MVATRRMAAIDLPFVAPVHAPSRARRRLVPRRAQGGPKVRRYCPHLSSSLPHGCAPARPPAGTGRAPARAKHAGIRSPGARVRKLASLAYLAARCAGRRQRAQRRGGRAACSTARTSSTRAASTTARRSRWAMRAVGATPPACPHTLPHARSTGCAHACLCAVYGEAGGRAGGRAGRGRGSVSFSVVLGRLRCIARSAAKPLAGGRLLRAAVGGDRSARRLMRRRARHATPHTIRHRGPHAVRQGNPLLPPSGPPPSTLPCTVCMAPRDSMRLEAARLAALPAEGGGGTRWRRT
jgi:hypothetical protein